jgi:uncharacterized protein (TIGR02117 family)
MHRVLLLLLLLATATFSAGCLGPRRSLFPPAANVSPKTIHVVSHGWHTGIIVRRADIPTNVWPARRDFARFEFIEVGWGDDGFYRADKITTAITVKALFWPTPSVLHVVGFNSPPAENFPASKLIRVELSPEGFTRLCAFIEDAYTRTASGQTIPLGTGLYGHSEFYRANGSYYFPRSCNYWTASALRSAGCPATPLGAVTASCLMFQVKRFGTLVQPDRGSAPPRQIIP